MNSVIRRISGKAVPAVKSHALSQPAAAPGDATEAYLAIARIRSKLTRIIFCAVVVIPTLLAILFYGLIASPRYVSETRFIVRSMSSRPITGIDVLFRTFGLAKTADDSYAIEKYLVSRDAVRDLLSRGIDLKAAFTRNEADFLSKYPYFWQKDSTEALFDYYTGRVKVIEDNVQGIVTLKVYAFRPEDAATIASSLLSLAEAMVNRLNQRAQSDAIDSANKEVQAAEAQVVSAQRKLTDYRNEQLIVDPAQSSTSLIETIGELRASRSNAAAQLAQMRATSPQSPAIPSLEARVAALDQRISAETAEMAGGGGSLATKMAGYEELVQQRDLAGKMLTSALGSLDSARVDARRQHIYVEEVVQPNVPDRATEPERLRSILTVLVLGLGVFSVGWLLVVGAGEHFQ